MCGIAGFFGNSRLAPNNNEILTTLNIMKNRGRDGNGICSLVLKKKKLHLLHSRLSIIDPHKRSDQPFQDDEGVVIFNGMIYNYLYVKKDLQNRNIKFKTNSDTEVLLKFLNYYGIKKINMLDGMWSFAYFNFSEKKLYLCRDRFGEKPLFYYSNNSSLIFGSYFDYILNLRKENKFKIDFNKIKNFIKHSWKCTYNSENGQTYFKNILALEPGCYIEYNQNGNLKKKNTGNLLMLR